MGKVPLMNKDTMAKKATLALTAMAAAKEKKQNSVPSEDAIAALDDVLSVATDYKFIGSGTRTYRNNKDPNNGAFCTAPVKYEFGSKEMRINAEKVLRARCGVNCAVPYPPLVRECIKQIVNSAKESYPDNFIKVSIDTGRMIFKTSRKPPKSSPDPGWKYGFADIPIPECVQDTGTRKIPEGFKLEIPAVKLPSPRKSRSDSSDTPMLIEEQATKE
jgi:hypothetical protein